MKRIFLIFALFTIPFGRPAFSKDPPKSDRQWRRLMIRAKSVTIGYYDGQRTIRFGKISPYQLKQAISKVRTSASGTSTTSDVSEMPIFWLDFRFASDDFQIHTSLGSRSASGTDGRIVFEDYSGPRDRVDISYLHNGTTKALRDFVYKRFDVAKLIKPKK